MKETSVTVPGREGDTRGRADGKLSIYRQNNWEQFSVVRKASGRAPAFDAPIRECDLECAIVIVMVSTKPCFGRARRTWSVVGVGGDWLWLTITPFTAHMPRKTTPVLQERYVKRRVCVLRPRPQAYVGQ